MLFRDQCVLLCMLFTEWDIVRESKCCVATRAHQQVEVAPAAPTPTPISPPPHASEVRTHGVGYYQFSQDEEQRHEQLAMLGRLREQVGGAWSMWAGLGAHVWGWEHVGGVVKT